MMTGSVLDELMMIMGGGDAVGVEACGADELMMMLLMLMSQWIDDEAQWL